MLTRLRVVMGTMDLGRCRLADDKPCFEMLDTFFSRGNNEVDTALMYCDGKSEQILGRYMKERKPSKAVVATKVNPFDGKSLSCVSVKKQMTQCLTSLQASSVDTFYLHAPDHSTALEGTLQACNQLHQEGKFKELALSNYAAWEVADIYNICKGNGWVIPTIYQGMYNAITRSVENEIFPCLQYFGLRFYAYNPLAGGLLTGQYKYSDLETQPIGRFFGVGGKWSAVYRNRYWRESAFKGMDMVRHALDESYGVEQVSLASASLRWLNHHSLMKPECGDAIVIGGCSVEHTRANLDACDEGPLDPRVVKAFDDAWQLDKANCHNYFR